MKENKNPTICCGGNYENVCPIFNAHDKLQESFFFLLQLADAYHFAAPFRFYLNAFLQSLRSVTMEKEPTPGAVVSFLSDFSKLNQDQKSTLEKKMANVPNSFAWVETLQKNGDCDWFDAPKNIQPGIHATALLTLPTAGFPVSLLYITSKKKERQES